MSDQFSHVANAVGILNSTVGTPQERIADGGSEFWRAMAHLGKWPPDLLKKARRICTVLLWDGFSMEGTVPFKKKLYTIGEWATRIAKDMANLAADIELARAGATPKQPSGYRLKSIWTAEGEAAWIKAEKQIVRTTRITLQYKTRQETLLEEELSEDKLTQLLASISQLDQTPAGAAELQRRRNSSASASESKAKPRASSTLGCVIGWTGRCRRRNRLSMLQGRLAISCGVFFRPCCR